MVILSLNIHKITKKKYCQKLAICKSRNGESGNGMMGTRGITVGTRGIRMVTRAIKEGMRGMGVGMRGIGVILCENLRVYCFGWNLGARGEHFTIQLFWEAARLLVTRILPCLPNGWVFLQGNEDVFMFLWFQC